LVCPRGHHAISIGATRFNCATCRRQGRETRSWDRSEVVDLRTEEPPLADNEDTRLVTDGGVPENFEDLVATCQTCGGDVEPKYLEDGECPGCVYGEPVADGGITWYDLTGFKRDCLRLLAEMAADDAKMHGLGLKRRLEKHYEQDINHGRLYPNLDDLVVAGLVEKGELDRLTNSYELTTVGQAMLRQQQEVWSDVELPQAAVADGGETNE
jgi:DNA-binding PadR family transcriptional regulator